MSDTNTPLDELGPVDYLIIEFPAATADFSGAMAEELIKLADAGTIRIVDILILAQDADGNVDAMELSDLDQLSPLQVFEAELAELLAEEDVDNLAAAMEPGSVAGVLIYENTWAAPFAAAAPRARPPPPPPPPLGWAADRQRPHPDPSHHRRRRSRRRARNPRSLTCH